MFESLAPSERRMFRGPRTEGAEERVNLDKLFWTAASLTLGLGQRTLKYSEDSRIS